ncbi:potassium channel family protein [Lacticaseibacillus saniviri]|uniref:Potassium transporter protein n=1 Tax=Lacticaseibacillus saniviri JCM 17471 = DSM 24301 TaxID=1293598 RepID=A0A0R2MUE6_9LACO|nr:TrkA family potassium uptake protein [Lacticaseibacillus saniviri]KRO16476.1 potassium transporter protein [Lacticaseibacillus saniviri JCM 17471 = DSM 24301]MCG4281751.1 TrkA family potassium uptake protein [Lacticaseibacillus saniviri]
MTKEMQAHSFVIFGLGRFGTSLVKNLATYDVELLVVDKDMNKVNEIIDTVDHAVTGDASDEDVLDRIGIGDFDVAVFAMGEDFEAAIMATMMAKEKGTARIVVKALDKRQAKILYRIGADQVILPEVEMGAKVAKSLVNPNILDFLDQANGISITEMHPDAKWVNQTIAEANIRQEAHINILAMIRDDHVTIPVKPTTILQANDVLIVIEQDDTTPK